MRRRYAILILGVLLAAGGAAYWRYAAELSLSVAMPERDVEVRVFGIGTVEAQVVSKVAFQVAGKVAAIAVDQGDLVASGTVLARLDDEAQRARLRKSEAAERHAAASLAKAQTQRERAEIAYQQKRSVSQRRQTLASRGTVAPEAAEDAQAAEDIAQGDVRIVEADARIAAVTQEDAAAQRDIEAVVLAQHELRAPFDARVIARHKELGSIAGAGEAVFTLVAPDSIWIRAYVDEALAGGLQLGQAATVRLRSEPERAVAAEIVRIDQENDRVTEERRVYVRCRSCGPQHLIRYLGEQAEVEIVKAKIASGLFVPLRRIDGYDGRSGTVWTVVNGRLARERIQLGARLLDGRVEVTSRPTGQIVIDERTDLREGRAARARGT
jgi:HlyD family secretion protein